MRFSSVTRGLVLGVSLALSAGSIAACSSVSDDSTAQSNALRSVTNEEALADFDQLVAAFKGVYGALERKEARYGFEINAMAAEYRARIQAASSDAEYQGIFVEFVSRFHDAHISLSPQFIGDNALISDDSHSFRIPVSVMPVENTFVVYSVDPSADGVHVGDELVAIDGQSPETLVQQFIKYAGTPNALTNRHFAAARLTGRSPYLSKAAGLHEGSTVTLRLRGADGQERDVVLTWKEAPHAMPAVTAAPRVGESTPKTMLAASAITEEITKAELSKMGSPTPFFMTPAVKTQLGFQTVAPTTAGLAKAGTTDPAKVAAVTIFAGEYALDGKKILFVRIPDYTPADEETSLNYLATLLSEQQATHDALVVDQTHNPGGSLFYALSVAQILSPGPINGFVQKTHADRMHIFEYASTADKVRPKDPQGADALMAEAQLIDQAYTAHKSLTGIMAPFAAPSVLPAANIWSKPVMMLVDELAVSCGDIVPSLIKANHVALLFGQTTMGGGGNVEEVATLTNTRWTLNVSRALGVPFDPTGAYPDERFIEDNGVSPDTRYSHTLADFRAGYVGYVKAFNTALSAHLATP
jgi:hypothetical protein